MYVCVFVFPKNDGNFLFLLARCALGSGGSVGAISDPWLRWDAGVVCESAPDIFILLRGGVRLSSVWYAWHCTRLSVDVCNLADAIVCISLLVCILM